MELEKIISRIFSLEHSRLRYPGCRCPLFDSILKPTRNTGKDRFTGTHSCIVDFLPVLKEFPTAAQPASAFIFAPNCIDLPLIYLTN